MKLFERRAKKRAHDVESAKVRWTEFAVQIANENEPDEDEYDSVLRILNRTDQEMLSFVDFIKNRRACKATIDGEAGIIQQINDVEHQRAAAIDVFKAAERELLATNDELNQQAAVLENLRQECRIARQKLAGLIDPNLKKQVDELTRQRGEIVRQMNDRQSGLYEGRQAVERNAEKLAKAKETFADPASYSELSRGCLLEEAHLRDREEWYEVMQGRLDDLDAKLNPLQEEMNRII